MASPMSRVEVWVRVLLLLATALVTAIPIIITYTFRHLLDWALRPAARRIPQPGDIVVVIGASTGIGESAARHLLSRGFRVFAGVRNTADYDRLQRLGMEPLFLDVTHPDQIAAAVKVVPDQVVLAAVICNAGVVYPGALEDITDDAIRSMIDINLTGAVLASKAFLPRLRRDGGRLIFTGSVCGFLPHVAYGVYSATKFAIRGLVLALAQELRPVGVSVSVVEPALTMAPSLGKVHDAVDKLPVGSAYAALARLVTQTLDLASGHADGPEVTTDVAIYKAVTDGRQALQYQASCTATFCELLSQFPTEFCDFFPTAYRATNGLYHGWS